MKITSRISVLFATLLLGTSVLMSGCATTGLDRAIKTKGSIQDVDTEIKKLVTMIDSTGAALDAVVSANPSDLKKKFEVYSDSVNNLDNESKAVMKRLDTMKANSKEYFTEWEKQGNSYTNPQIRELSEQRRAQLAETYGKISQNGAGIKDAFNVYLTDLKEIQKYLSNDLTPAGVKLIEPVTKKTTSDLGVLKESFAPVTAALEAVKSQLFGGSK